MARRAHLIWFNFPNNPTGAVANPDFYRRLIAWAKEYDVVVVHDNPYTEICFDGYRPPSLPGIPGAREVGVEMNSLSKAYNCCGWRVGMLVGNKDVVAAVAKIKSHSDRGLYYPLQAAATAALNGPDDFMHDRNRVPRAPRRRRLRPQGDWLAG